MSSLKKNDNIVILKADKGNVTVILDKTIYKSKCEDLLLTPTYGKLKRDPTEKIKRRIMEILKELKTSNIALFDKLKPTNSMAPRFYGLPKLHKPDIPLRPIVSAIGSPTYSIAKFVTSIISPLVGKTSSFVRNSTHFKDMIMEEIIDKNEIMVSFDVKSLFTNVPIDDAIRIARNKLQADESLVEHSALSPDEVVKLLEICLNLFHL